MNLTQVDYHIFQDAASNCTYSNITQGKNWTVNCTDTLYQHCAPYSPNMTAMVITGIMTSLGVLYGVYLFIAFLMRNVNNKTPDLIFIFLGCAQSFLFRHVQTNDACRNIGNVLGLITAVLQVIVTSLRARQSFQPKPVGAEVTSRAQKVCICVQEFFALAAMITAVYFVISDSSAKNCRSGLDALSIAAVLNAIVALSIGKTSATQLNVSSISTQTDESTTLTELPSEQKGCNTFFQT